mgnify:CR=1 FL=1
MRDQRKRLAGWLIRLAHCIDPPGRRPSAIVPLVDTILAGMTKTIADEKARRESRGYEP